jgi:choline dehydrogenase-like flavoprotein
MGRAFNRMGWHWWPADAAIITEDYEGRGGCLNLGPCSSGCAQGAKGSADVTYWPKALRKGVELRTRCRVREITVGPDDMATGVVYYDAEGREVHQRAEVVVLACNGVGTPRLLLNSRSARFPDGLANRSGLVGRNLMFHPWGHVSGRIDEFLGPNHGPGGCCLLSQQFYETDASRGYVRGFTFQIGRGSAGPVTTALNGLASGDIPWGAGHHAAFARQFGHTVGLGIITEDLPEAHNRVTLDPVLTDSHGIPAPKIDYTVSDNTLRMLRDGIRRGTELLQAAGARDIRSSEVIRMAGWHLMGTARMGNDPERSVVNGWGRSHDVRNLFIVDGSLFVTSAAVNPTSTIQALALYVADSMKRNLANLFD